MLCCAINTRAGLTLSSALVALVSRTERALQLINIDTWRAEQLAGRPAGSGSGRGSGRRCCTPEKLCALLNRIESNLPQMKHCAQEIPGRVIQFGNRITARIMGATMTLPNSIVPPLKSPE